MADTPIYALKNISLAFGDNQLFENVELYVSKGDKICLVGRNGSGKSTLIKLILLEETPTSGKIYVNAHNVSKIKKTQVQRYRRSIGGKRVRLFYPRILKNEGR